MLSPPGGGVPRPLDAYSEWLVSAVEAVLVSRLSPPSRGISQPTFEPPHLFSQAPSFLSTALPAPSLPLRIPPFSSSSSSSGVSSSSRVSVPSVPSFGLSLSRIPSLRSSLLASPVLSPPYSSAFSFTVNIFLYVPFPAASNALMSLCESDVTFYPQTEIYSSSDSTGAAQPSSEHPFSASLPVLRSSSKLSMPTGHSASRERVSSSCPEPHSFGHSASDIRNWTTVMHPRTRAAEYGEAKQRTYLCVLLERWLFSFSLPALHATSPGIASTHPLQPEILCRNLSTALRAFLAFAYFLPTYSALASASSLLFPPGQDGDDSIVLSSLTLAEGPHEGVHCRAEQRPQARSVTPPEEEVERMKVASGEMLLTANMRECPRASFKKEDLCALAPSSHSSPAADSPVLPPAARRQPLQPSAVRVSAGATDPGDSHTASPTRLGDVSDSPRREDCGSYAQHSVSEEALSWCSVFPYGNALDCKAPPVFSAYSQAHGSFSSRSCYLQNTQPSWKLEASVNVSLLNPHVEKKGRPCLSLLENSTPVAAYASACAPDFSVTMQQQRGILAEGNVRPARVAASLIPGLAQPRGHTTQKSATEYQPFCFGRDESTPSEACYGRKRLADRRSPQETSQGTAGSLVDQSRGSARRTQTRTDCPEPSEAKTADNFSEVPAFSIPFGEGTLSCSVAFREDLAFAIQSAAEASGSTLSYESSASEVSCSRSRYFDGTLSQNSSRENCSERSAAENVLEVDIPCQQENSQRPLDRSRCISSGLHELRSAVNTAGPPRGEDNEKLCHRELGSDRSATGGQGKKKRRGGSQTCVPLLSGGQEGIFRGGNSADGDPSKCPIYGMEAVGFNEVHARAFSSTAFSSQAHADGSRVHLSRSPYRHSGKDPSIQAPSSAQESSTDSARPMSETGKISTSDNTKSPTTDDSSSRSDGNSAGLSGVQGTASSNDDDLSVGEGRFCRDSGVDAGRGGETSESGSPAGRFDPSFNEDGLLGRRLPRRFAAARRELPQTERNTSRTFIHDEGVRSLTGSALPCFRPLADSGVGPACADLENKQAWSERGGLKEALPAASSDIQEELVTQENDFLDTVPTLRAQEEQSPDTGEDSPEQVSSCEGSTELPTSVAAWRNPTPGEQTERAGMSGKNNSSHLELSSCESSFGEPGLSRHHLEHCSKRTAPLVLSAEVNPSAEARARWGLLLQRAAPSSAPGSAPVSGTPPSVIRCPSDYTLRTPLPSSESPALVEFPSGSFPWPSSADLFLGTRQDRETARRRRSGQAVDSIQAEKGDDKRLQYQRVTGGAGRTGSTAVFTDGELEESFFRIAEKARLSTKDHPDERGKNTVSDGGPRDRVSTRRRDRAIIVLDRDHEQEESDDDEESELGSVSSLLSGRKTGRRQEEQGRKQVDFWSDWTKEEMDYEHYAFPSVSKEYRRKHLVDLLASLRSGYLGPQCQAGSRTPGESQEHQGYRGIQVGLTASEGGDSARGTKISKESADWDTEEDGLFFSFWVAPDPVRALSYLDATRVPLQQDPEGAAADESTGNTERDEERGGLDGEDEVSMSGKKEGREEKVSRHEESPADPSTVSNMPSSSGSGFSLNSYVEEAANPPSGWTRGAWRDALEKIRFAGVGDFLETPSASSSSFAASLCLSRSSSRSASAAAFEGRTCPVLPGITLLSPPASSLASTSAISSRCLLPHPSSSMSLPSSPTSSGTSGSSASSGSAVCAEQEERRLLSVFLSELQQDDASFLFSPSFPHAGYHEGAHRGVEEKSRLARSKEVEMSRPSGDPEIDEEEALHLFSHLTQLLLVPELPVQGTSAASASRGARRVSPPLVPRPGRGEGERRTDSVLEVPSCTTSVFQLSQEKDTSTPRERVDDGPEHERRQTGKKPERSERTPVDTHRRERAERKFNGTRSGRKSHVESSSRRSKDSDWQRQLRFLEKQLAYFTDVERDQVHVRPLRTFLPPSL